MKKTFYNVLSIGILLTSNSLFSQNKVKLGLDAGYTYTSLNTDISNLIDSKYNSRYGFGINFTAEVSIWKTLFVSSGLSYLQKNYEFQRTGIREGWYTKYDNDFISLPVLVGGYILNDPNQSTGVWIKIAGGMYTEYWLSMRREGQYPVLSELQTNGTVNYRKISDKYDFDKNENQLKRFGYGLQGQAQLGYSFDKIDVYASYNYQYGLSDMIKYNNNNRKTTKDSYMISAGVSYKFN